MVSTMILRAVLAMLGGATAMLTSAQAASAWCVVQVQRGDVLQIRSGPGPGFNSVGAIPPTACGVKIIGPCSGSWCPVEFQRYRGFSNSYYLLSETTPAGARMAAERRGISRAATARSAPRSSQQLAAVPLAPGPEPAPPRAAPPAAPPPPAPAPVRERPVEAPRPVQAAVPAPKEPTPERAPAAPQVTPPPAPQQRDVCVRGIPKGDTLKVRANPSSAAELRYGFLPDTCGVKITGDCRDSWCPVEYRGYRGWAEEKNLK